MPVYEVELDGHRYQIEGERPPTEADVRAALGAQKPTEEETPGALSTLGRSTAAGLAPSAAAAAAFVPGMAVGAPFSEFAGPAAPAVPLVTGALASLGAGAAAEFGQEKLLEKYAPGFLKKLQTGSQAHPIAASIGRVASAAPSFAVAPGQAIEGAISLPRVLRGEAIDAEKQAAKALFAQLGAQTGITAAQTGLTEHRLPTAGELLESAAAGVIYGHPNKWTRVPLPAALEKGLVDYASRQRKAAEIHGNVRAQPETGVPEQEGRARVQPRTEAQTQGLGQKAQIPLTPVIRVTGSDATGYSIHIDDKTESGFKTREEANEAIQAIGIGERELQTKKAEQATPLEEEKALAPGDFDVVNQMERAAITEGENVGTPITPVDKFTTEDDNVPFAGVYLSATGNGAELHRGEFRKQINYWLNKGFRPDQIREMVISAVNEERLHNDVMANSDKPQVEGYWNDLTGLEQKIEHYIYHASTKPRGFDTPYRMGHEAIRRRLQKAMKLPVREFLETVGREHWKLRGLDLLGDMVRKSRELLGTKASERQRMLYDRVLGNIGAAQAVLTTGQVGPGASRRKLISDDPREQRINYLMFIGDKMGKKANEDFQEMGWEGFSRQFLSGKGHAIDVAQQSGEALNEAERLKDEIIYDPKAPRQLRAKYWEERTKVNTFAANKRRADVRFEFKEGHATQRQVDEADRDFDYYRRYQKAGFVPAEETHPMWKETYQRLIDHYKDQVEFEMRYVNNPPANQFDAQGHRWARDPEEVKQSIKDTQAQIDKYQKAIDTNTPIPWRPPSSFGPAASRREERPSERITAAAVVTPNGNVETGANHPEILDRLGVKGFEKAESRNTPDFGFATTHRPFITREEAGPVSTASGQNLKEFEPGEPVHSDEVAAPGTRTPISELGPGASRREKEETRAQEQGQKEMYGIEVKGLGSTLPPVAPAQRQVPLPGPVTPIEQAAQSIFEGRRPSVAGREPEAVEPSFREFFKWAKQNVSGSIQSGPLFDVWLDTVNRNLERAPGAKLNELVESLGIQSRVYPWKKRYAGAPKDYTRIEVPDFGKPPADPLTMPVSWEAGIRERVAATPMFEEGTMSEDELAKAQDKAVERARKEFTNIVKSQLRPEEIETRKMEREGAIKGQKLRNKALSAIFQKMIEEGAPSITDLTPKDITWEDIAWNNPNAKDFGAYYTIRPEDRQNPDKLHEIFHEEARRNKYETLSHTRKLAVLLNRKTGQVALVSAYPVPKSRGSVRIVEPSGATGKMGKPNVAIDSALRRNWEPIFAILKKEPVKDFHKGFKDIADYNQYLGTDAAQAESRSRESMDVGLRPDDVHEDVPEFATTQDWQERQMAMEPTEHDLATIVEEQQRPTEEFIGPQPSKEVGEQFRPGTAVVHGEGGMFTGPEAGEARMAAGQMWRSRPLSVAEAMAVHSYLNDPDEWAAGAIAPEVASATTKEGMQQALQRLVDLASNNRLKPRQWTIISALRKMALEQYLRDREEFKQLLRDEREAIRKLPKAERAAARAALEQFRPTAEGSMAAALNKIYEINQATDKQGDYLAQVMGEFARPTPEVKTPETAGGTTGARELTVPRFAGRPIPLEPLPADYGRRTEASPSELLTPEGANFVAAEAAKEFKYDPKLAFESLPVFEIAKSKGNITDYEIQAAFRLVRPTTRKGYIEGPVTRTRKELGPGASIREVKDWTAAEWDRISTYVKKVATDPLFRKEQAQELRSRTRKYAEVPRKRATTEHDMLAGADGADHQVSMYSTRLSNNIRSASVKPGAEPKKQTLLQRFFNPVLYSKEAVRVREIAKAIPAAREEANSERYQELWRQWQEWKRTKAEMEPEREEARRKHEKVPPLPPVPEYKEPTYEELRPEHFDRAIINAEEGVRRATEQLKSPTAVQRIIARRWLKAAERLLGEAREARERFKEPELRRTYETYQAVADQHLDNMNRHGMNVSGRDYYVPGRYEGQMWADDAILWGDMRIIGRQFRLPKTMKNYYAAIKEGPYIPVNYDLADLAQHSLAAGGKVMARDAWIEGLKHVTDPESGQPVVIEPVWGKVKPAEMSQSAFDEMIEELRKKVQVGKPVPQEILMSLLRQMGVTKKPFGFQVPEGREDYQLVWPTQNSKPMAVRVGYKKLVDTVMARSQVRDLPVLGPALTASQMLKHGAILILDTFHPGRLSQYYLALAGKNPHSAYRNGISALMWSPESLDEAVHIGAISKESADWAREEIKLHDRDQIWTTTRHDLLRRMVSRGLNASQTADTLYRNSIQRIPFIGDRWNRLLAPANKWIFERITPGLIAESAVRELERMNPKAKGLSLDAQIREVVRDTNVFYGNLGRNGIFKHPTTRDLAQVLLLAPLWQEGLINKELRTIARVTQLSRLAGRTGLPPSFYYGSLTRGMVRGLAAYFVLTQMINLATRRKWTFQNEESDHKLDAWLPIGGQGAWLSPLSVFGEVTHDLVRFGETKPKNWDAITQFGRNKLGPIGRLAWVLAEGKSPTGEDISTTGGVIGRAARELAPAPISVGTFAQAAAPGLFGKPRAGAVGQRLISSVGIKTQLADRAETQVRRLASSFVKQHNLAYEPLQFTPTDQASYAKLRGALRNDDEASAARTLKELRRHRSNAQILKAMRLASERPFTGSRSNETMFLYSLNNDQLDEYFKASLQRSEDYQKFLNFYTRQP